MAERLYGIIAGGAAMTSEGPREFTCIPDPKLLKEIGELPQGTKIGLSCFPEIVYLGQGAVIDLEEGGLTIPDYVRGFWGEVYRACHRAKLDVTFLDALDLHQLSARFQLDKQKLANGLRRQFGISPEEAPVVELDYTVRSLMEDMWQLEVGSDFVYSSERERHMAELIEQKGIEVVVMDLEFADLRQLTIGNGAAYLRDTSSDSAMVGRRFIGTYQGNLALVEPNADVLFDREMLFRRHNAATVWRVEPKDTPDFIGSWSVRGCEPRTFGLFEITLTDGKKGICKDASGDAGIVVVERSDNRIMFVKTYRPGRHVENAVKADIIYDLTNHGGMWRGQWKRPDGRGAPCVMFTGSEFKHDQF